MNSAQRAFVTIFGAAALLVALALPAAASHTSNDWLGEQGPSGTQLHGVQGNTTTILDNQVACPQDAGDSNWLKWFIKGGSDTGPSFEIGIFSFNENDSGTCSGTHSYNYADGSNLTFTRIDGPVGGGTYTYSVNRVLGGQCGAGNYCWQFRVDGTPEAWCCGSINTISQEKAGLRCFRSASTGTACPSNTKMAAQIGNLKVKRADNDNWVDWSSPWGHCVDESDGAEGDWFIAHTDIVVAFNDGGSGFTACPGF